MADMKITALIADATPTSTDLLLTVDDPSGSPVNKKATIADVVAAVVSAWARGGTKPSYTMADLGLDADLTTLALPANTTITAAGAELINDADAAAQRATLGAMPASGAWASCTPAIAASTGTFTTVSCPGYWVQIGKMVTFTFRIDITTNGSAAGIIQLTLPVVGKHTTHQILGGQGVGDVALVGYVDVTNNFLCLTLSGGAYAGGTGAVVLGGVVYEAA